MAAPSRPSSSPARAVVGGHIRTTIARYRLVRVGLVVAVAVLGAAIVNQAQQRASDAVARWEPDGVALIAVHSIGAGEVVGAADVALRPIPAGLRPADAVVDLPSGARASTAIVVGEVLRSGRLDPAAASAIAAQLPAGHLAFAVPADDLAAAVGDAVRLYDLTTGDAAVPTGLVVERDDTHLTVAVADRDAPGLIRALGRGGVVAAITSTAAIPGS